MHDIVHVYHYAVAVVSYVCRCSCVAHCSSRFIAAAVEQEEDSEGEEGEREEGAGSVTEEPEDTSSQQVSGDC